jgi:hypothetical protein
MPWNYRLVRYRDGSGYGLHEIFYDGDGQPTGMTEQPISFGCDRNEDAEANSQLEGRSTAVCRPRRETGGGGAAAEPAGEGGGRKRFASSTRCPPPVY